MGYSDGRSVPLYPPFKDVHIELRWRDIGESGKRFATVQELAAFLKAHPILAEAVGYVPRKEKQQLEVRITLPDNFFKLTSTDQTTWLASAKDIIVRRRGSVHFSGRVFPRGWRAFAKRVPSLYKFDSKISLAALRVVLR